MTQNYLALDFGASGGRAMIGRFDGERLHLEEVHRFAERAGGVADRVRQQPVLGRRATVQRGQRRAG